VSRHLITVAFLAIAVGCYAVGFIAEGAVFIALGAVSEGVFWIRLFRRTGLNTARKAESREG
jgi:hypothetical protein